MSSELNKYQRLKFKVKFLSADINFLRDCRRLKVFPNFMKFSIKITNERTRSVRKKILNFWLKEELKYLYAKRNSVELELYILHLKITKNLTNIEYDAFSKFEWSLHEKLSVSFRRKYTKLNNKLRKFASKGVSNIQEQQHSSNFEEKRLVINESSSNFTQSEIECLEKGFKFALQPTHAPIDEIVADIELGISKLTDENCKEELRLATKNSIEKFRQTEYRPAKTSRNFLKTLKTLKSKDCFYTKADKGNSIVIMDKSDYKERMNNLLQQGPYTLLDKNPLRKMETEIDNFLKKYQHHFDDPYWRRKLKTTNASIPKLYGLPKIHKPGKKMREISDNTCAPSYNLSKWISKQLNNLPQPRGKYVKNTYDFVDRIKNITLEPDELLVSFDVSALFPSIPIDHTLTILEEWLDELNIEDWRISLYSEAIKICMNQNVFSMDNKIYKQTDGTTMGNSISPFMANLFMSNFETKLENNALFPRIWYRYVDDVFAVVKHDLIYDTLNLLNSQHPSIKFTHELENNHVLPFLDVKLIRNGNSVELDIYRKPTSTYRYITGDSYHSFSQKYSAFHSMIYRLINIPLTQERFDKEKNFILELASFNKLDTTIINNIINKHTRKKLLKETTLSPITDNTQNSYFKLTYFPPITNHLTKAFLKHKMQPVYTSSSKIKNILGTTKDKTDDFDKSGIYKINCEGCNQVYIGMTSRKLKQRFTDHLLDIKNGSQRTALSKHIKSENESYGRGKRRQKQHNISLNNVQLLKSVNGFSRLSIWESVFIRKHRNVALNENNGLVNTSLLQLIDCTAN